MERGRVTAKGRSEADTILQAQREGKVSGTPRRPNPLNREPDHDFALEQGSGQPIRYVEIKTPIAPKLRPIEMQAKDVASKIMLYPEASDLTFIVDLKNLAPADKAIFLQKLVENGLDSSIVQSPNK